MVKEADLVLFMVDAGTGIGYDEEIIYDALKEKETILVVNKTDLLNKEENVWIPEKWKIQRVVRISAKYNQGVQRLKQDVYDFAVKARGVRESAMVPNLRQKKLLMAAREAVKGGGGGPSGGLCHPRSLPSTSEMPWKSSRKLSGKMFKRTFLKAYSVNFVSANNVSRETLCATGGGYGPSI